YEFHKNASALDVLRATEGLKEEEGLEREFIIAGRIISLRGMGKISFAHLQDFTARIQLFVDETTLKERELASFKKLSVGDVVGVHGKPFRTKRGEITLRVSSLETLAKAIRPLPEKWHGLEDPELKYRMRYVDLISDPTVKETFVKRSAVLESMRKNLSSQGFIEVETPMMQPIPGGAAARPFATYHNELGMNLYLRIAPELYLKRLIVGGFEKVFEINRNFRNEGIDLTHNPEFTMLELYWAHVDYEKIMKLTEEVIEKAAIEVLGSAELAYQGKKISLKAPFKRLSMTQACRELGGVDVEKLSQEQLLQVLKENKADAKLDHRWGALVLRVFDELAQPKIVQPTFVVDYPIETSYLVKKKRGNEKFTERAELFIDGKEFANIYSELTDPVEQRQRFEDQQRLREKGDVEAQAFDEDFLKALEYGMPPTGGLGIGVDRLVMLLADKASIRDVILFPHLRPEKGRSEEEKQRKKELLAGHKAAEKDADSELREVTTPFEPKTRQSRKK
ncbi:MAG TPA: lysine--tRNA ligase, partial [archaeon]|nr:lysine--tRNA ligase [archaeon]